MSFEMWLQSRLTAHGYPVGLIDGHIGPVTTKALAAFQRAKGLSITGIADDATVTALRLSATAVVDPIPARAVQPQPKTVWPYQGGCPSFYGPVGTDQVQIDLPYAMALAWDKSTVLRKMTLHRKVAPSARRVLQTVADTYSASERASLGLNLFGGSLNVRRMRGGTSYSMHSWGIAIDFDPERNQLAWGSPVARLSHADALPFWRAWEAEGWLSLGRARNYDWMHVQAARL